MIVAAAYSIIGATARQAIREINRCLLIIGTVLRRRFLFVRSGYTLKRDFPVRFLRRNHVAETAVVQKHADGSVWGLSYLRSGKRLRCCGPGPSQIPDFIRVRLSDLVSFRVDEDNGAAL
jgi:hypothetical protein